MQGQEDLSKYTRIPIEDSQDEILLEKNPDRDPQIQKLSARVSDGVSSAGEAAKSSIGAFANAIKRKTISIFNNKSPNKNPILWALTGITSIFTVKTGLNYLLEFDSKKIPKPNLVFRTLELITGLTASTGLISAVLLKEGNKFISAKSSFIAAGAFAFIKMIGNTTRDKAPRLLKVFGFDRPLSEMLTASANRNKNYY